MDTKVTAQVVKHYFAGHCTAAEEALVEEWLNADPEHPRLAQQWMEEHAAPDENLYAQLIGDQEQVWNNIAQNLPEPVLIPNSHSIAGKPLLWKVAASIGGIVLLAVALYVYQVNKQIVITTGYGKVQSITLPDQSVVFLNGNSSLAYPQNWQSQNREVWLDGEAFFDVRHMEKDQKFTVHLSEKAAVEVLGTEFTVSDRQAGKSIVLQSGKIRLSFEDKDVVYLQPGEKVELPAGNTATNPTRTKVNPHLYSSWTAGKWMLEGTSLAEILRKLKETYGITVVSQDTSLVYRKASGSIPLPAQQTVDASLLVRDIADLFELEVSKNNGIIYYSTK
jgi:ferric-dicitrate binding protein FerR (iron transport regulator)